jgi:hypothetical protein
MIPYEARTFKAKTVRVHSISAVEVILDLDFGVSISKVITLDGLMPSDISEEDKSKAHHCLIVLLGGKRLLVQPDPTERKFWGRKTDTRSRLFLDERVFGSPVGLTTNVFGDVGEYVDVVPFLKSLAANGFNVADVKAVLNRRFG